MQKTLMAFLKDDSGQAVLEFILLAAVSIAIVSTLKVLLRNFTASIWSALGSRIAAPCTDVSQCDPGADFDL